MYLLIQYYRSALLASLAGCASFLLCPFYALSPEALYDIHDGLWHDQHAIIDTISVVASGEAGLFAPEEQAQGQQAMHGLLKYAVRVRRLILRSAHTRGID